MGEWHDQQDSQALRVLVVAKDTLCEGRSIAEKGVVEEMIPAPKRNLFCRSNYRALQQQQQISIITSNDSPSIIGAAQNVLPPCSCHCRNHTLPNGYTRSLPPKAIPDAPMSCTGLTERQNSREEALFQVLEGLVGEHRHAESNPPGQHCSTP